MPRSQDIKEAHGEGKPSLELRPGSMKDLLKAGNGGQHGEDGLDDHALIPGALGADFEVGWVASGGVKMRLSHETIGQVLMADEQPKQPNTTKEGSGTDVSS